MAGTRWAGGAGLISAPKAWARACVLVLPGILKTVLSLSQGQFTITAGPPAASGWGVLRGVVEYQASESLNKITMTISFSEEQSSL